MKNSKADKISSLPWMWKEKANGGFSIEIDDGTIYAGTIREVSTIEEAERIVRQHNERTRS